MKKTFKNKKSVLALENLTIPLYRISYLRKDPITKANICKLNDGGALSLSDDEYKAISEEMEKSNEDAYQDRKGER